MNEQEQFNQLQQEIANGKQDIDLDDFAKRFAAAVEGVSLAVDFDPANWDWTDVENAVGYGILSVDEVRSMIRIGLS